MHGGEPKIPYTETISWDIRITAMASGVIWAQVRSKIDILQYKHNHQTKSLKQEMTTCQDKENNNLVRWLHTVTVVSSITPSAEHELIRISSTAANLPSKTAQGSEQKL